MTPTRFALSLLPFEGEGSMVKQENGPADLKDKQ